MKRRKVTTFSLSFLDCICCGLGAVILLFVLVNAKSAAHRDALTSDLRAEVDRLEHNILEDKKNMIEARNALEQTLVELVRTEGLSRELIRTLKEKKTQLADQENDTIASRRHVNKLKSDLNFLEKNLVRLKAGAETKDELGSKLRRFPGQGDRQYLTDLKMGGNRIFILVDASASMLDETIVGIIRGRNLSDKKKLESEKWKRAVATVDWLLTQLPSTSKFQVYTFNETASPLIKDKQVSWLEAGEVYKLNEVFDHLQKVIPEKGTSLLNAFKAMGEMEPAPDNIFLLVDSLPTMGASKPWGKRVSGKKRLSLFNEAIRLLPSRVPVNIILYPIEGDPLAASAYWRLAKDTKGSFFCPSRDWP